MFSPEFWLNIYTQFRKIPKLENAITYFHLFRKTAPPTGQKQRTT